MGGTLSQYTVHTYANRQVCAMYSVGCIHMYNQVVGSSAKRIEARDRITCWRLLLKTIPALFKRIHILDHYLYEGATSMRGNIN